MEKIYNATPNRSFRKWIKQLFLSWNKRPNQNYLEEIFEKLQEIEDSIEILARQIARQVKRGE